jgi:hypothetical protein
MKGRKIMKITKTNFDMKVNVSSSWIVYITKDLETAQNLLSMEMVHREMLCGEWYYSVSTCKVMRDCRVPSFFHGEQYYSTIVEHNNGDWDKPQSYSLYIVE